MHIHYVKMLTKLLICIISELLLIHGMIVHSSNEMNEIVPKYNVDFTTINHKLHTLGLPQLDLNLVENVLQRYGTSIEDIENVFRTTNNNSEKIHLINNIFKCNILYTDDQGNIEINSSTIDNIFFNVQQDYLSLLSEPQKTLSAFIRIAIAQWYRTNKRTIEAGFKDLISELEDDTSTKRYALEEESFADRMLGTLHAYLINVISILKNYLLASIKTLSNKLQDYYRFNISSSIFEEICARVINFIVFEGITMLDYFYQIVDNSMKSSYFELTD